MILSKKPTLSEYGTLCTIKSTQSVFPSHINIPYTNTVFPEGEKTPVSASSILLSVLRKVDYSGDLFLYLADDFTVNHHSYL